MIKKNGPKKMKIFLLFCIVFLIIVFIFNKVFYSAKRSLFKDQAAWSGNDIKIKYKKSKEISESIKNENYLQTIAEESKCYLEDQSTKEEK
tara:strand:- start:109 stop:381 length:273 start_codon:yes stop_codon:yes gene_type:complete